MWAGQFYDMLHLFSLTGEPCEKHCLLMNGDLVDRGSWSIEVILTAFAYKCECLARSCVIRAYIQFGFVN
jgi:hypothetical protein